jgi:hypothetical protein
MGGSQVKEIPTTTANWLFAVVDPSLTETRGGADMERWRLRVGGGATRLCIAMSAAVIFLSPSVVLSGRAVAVAKIPDTTIGGGRDNEATGEGATVAGGLLNWATLHGSVGGGVANKAFGEGGTVGGGSTNSAGKFGTVGGGEFNNAYGAGRLSPVATATTQSSTARLLPEGAPITRKESLPPFRVGSSTSLRDMDRPSQEGN